MRRPAAAFALAAALVIAAASAWWSSPEPDDLEWVADRLGFADAADEQATPLPDYARPGGGVAWETAVAGMAGAILCLGAGAVLVALARRTAA